MRRRGEQEGPGTNAVTAESAFGIAVLARRRALFASIKDGTGDRAQRSRGTPGVPMVQAADLRDGNNFALRRRFDAAWCRRIAIQREMRAGRVVVVEILGQDAMQMGLVEHDEMIQTIAAYGTDDRFTRRILQGCPWCNQHFLDAHVLDALLEVVTVDAVPVAQKKTWGFVVGEGVDDLLGGPFGVGMVGHVEVNGPPPVMTQHDEHVENAERDRRHGEEVAGSDVGNMIGKERSPELRGRLPDADHVLGHRPLRNLATQQEQFRQNSGRAPERILTGHAAYQVSECALDTRASRFPAPRLPSPVELEAPLVPFDDCFGLDDSQRRSPVGPEPGKQDPEEAVSGPQLRAFDGLLVDGNLLSQRQILGGQAEPGYQERSDQKIDRLDDAHGVAPEVDGTR